MLRSLLAMYLVFLPSVRLLICAALLSAAACDGIDTDEEDSCNGSAKCDNPEGPATPHSIAVGECDERHVAALKEATGIADQVEIESLYHRCLLQINDASVATIEDNLKPEQARTRDEIITVLNEFRYASLCVDVESSIDLTGDELNLEVALCESRRERSLAQAVGALVDFPGERTAWELSDERDSFAGCYVQYDDAIALNPTPLQIYQASGDLVSCCASDLRAHSQLLVSAQCQLLGECDELLLASFITAGFDTAITTSDRTCELLFDSSVYRQDGDPIQLRNCQISVYAQLKTAILEGLKGLSE